MAAIKGVKEKVHLPLYDSIFVRPKEQFSKNQTSNVLRFFQDVTGKTKLLTNMQAASLLPHWNTYEARAMRVVISDLATQFPDAPAIELEFPNITTKPKGSAKDATTTLNDVVKLTNFNLRHFVDFKRRVEGPYGQPVTLNKQDDLDALGLKIFANNLEVDFVSGEIKFDRTVLKDAELKFESRVLPPSEQVFPNNGFGSLIGKFIYNSVTTFFVGEKSMIQVPTWFFPAGAGPYSEDGKVTTHGAPDPQATFRFAEPIFIDTQQNFRVEIEIPENDVLSEIQRLYGPFFIWVAIDGYMTRDVQ
jgi:hypothetical protein